MKSNYYVGRFLIFWWTVHRNYLLRLTQPQYVVKAIIEDKEGYISNYVYFLGQGAQYTSREGELI